MASDRVDALRAALTRVDELRGEALELARHVVAEPDGSHGQTMQLAGLRQSLTALTAAEAAERTLIDYSALSPLLVGALDEVGISYRDDLDLAPVLGRVPDLSEQLLGLSALHRAVVAQGLR